MTKENVTLLGAIAVGGFALIGWLWWLSSWLMEQYALDDVAIQSEAKFGVEVIQSGSPESPSAGHLKPPFTSTAAIVKTKARTGLRICRGYMPLWR